MFMNHDAARLPIPPELFEPPGGAAIFNYTECVGNHPIWLLHAGMHPDGGGESIWQKRILVGSPKEACAILNLEMWVTRRLYVILPDYMTRKARLSLEECITVFECKEPLSNESCWRIETESGTVLDSIFGTQLGAEIDARLRWSRGEIS